MHETFRWNEGNSLNRFGYPRNVPLEHDETFIILSSFVPEEHFVGRK